jgi:hypothetical protein
MITIYDHIIGFTIHYIFAYLVHGEHFDPQLIVLTYSFSVLLVRSINNI